MLVVEECIGSKLTQVCLNATDGQIHLCHLPGRWVAILSEYGDVVEAALMFVDESGRLHKHAARTAARVVHATAKRLQHLDQRTHNAGRRVEFASQLAFGFGKLGEAIFVGATQNVFRVAMLFHLDVGEKVHHIAQAAFV